ncbi:sulfate/molybdate ABC transporter ATP-binding protein [Bacillus sp. MRMR6]|uniref:sulfate/molybdate ABC transporter ATP-binding protein n=1 Tax=Bacillus sp. MRMR6 TaxID=1928617 RepID=UPI000951836B|nr:ABC transporter ATP-binding protein [Bacillus sp. MRMR6]OLS41391.1 ABC transporter [Bacillus sp. MRMR6]
MLKVAITKTLKHFQLNAEFAVGTGITGIIGPSGCGKSVTLQCLAGLQNPDHGEILLNGQPLYQSNNRTNIKSRNRNIGYVFQNYALFPHLTVEKNIEYGLKGKKNSLEKKQIVSNMIEKVQLVGYEEHYPSQLSGGQQQRVALARTLVTDPDLLLLDEPFSALDHHVKHILEQELLNILRENYSGIVLLVTHNMEEAYRLCDHLILYDNGVIIQSGKKEEIFKKPVNISAAKIIGCKNILPVNSIKETTGHLECQVQGIKLRLLKQTIPFKATHIGIYSENIRFTKHATHSDNLFQFTITEMVKGIHQTNITLLIENTFSIVASISNHEVDSLIKENYKVELSPSFIFLLENR